MNPSNHHIYRLAAVLTVLAACAPYASESPPVGHYLAQWRALTPPPSTIPSAARTSATDGPSVASRASLDMAGGVAVAMMSNPALRVLRLRAGMVQAGAEVSGAWSNPVLSAELRSAMDGRPDPWFVAAGLAFTIPLSGRHGLRRDRDLASAKVEQLTVLAQERATATRVRRAWLAWSLAEQETSLYAAYVASLKAIDTTARRLSAAGESDPGSSRVLPIALARAQILWSTAKQEGRQARARLIALMGLSPNASLDLAATLNPPVTRSVPPEDWPRHHVRVRLAQAGVALGVAAVSLAQSERSPDLSLGAVVEHQEGATSAGVALSLPIPSLDLRRTELVMARGGAREARARTELAVQQVVWARSQQLGGLRSAQQRLDAFQTLQTLVREQLSQVEALAAKGELNALLVRHAMREALEVRLGMARARHDIAVAQAELLELGGHP